MPYLEKESRFLCETTVKYEGREPIPTLIRLPLLYCLHLLHQANIHVKFSIKYDMRTFLSMTKILQYFKSYGHWYR